MFTQILVPLDGSKAAEMVLPYARFLASKLGVPVNLLAVIDVVEIGLYLAPDKAHLLNSVIETTLQRGEQYLKSVAGTFSDVRVNCSVERGLAAEIIIGKAAEDKGTLISMAAHGRSGKNQWLLGSVAEKVLRGASNPVLLYRPLGGEKPDGHAFIRSIIVPLDGSELAETVLRPMAELAKQLDSAVLLFRTYHVPYTALVPVDGYYPPIDIELIHTFRDEATSYLEKKLEALKQMGVAKVSYVAKEGSAADEIITLAQKTPDNLIAMCTHGRSGVKRWILGSVTEKVVRHSSDPVFVVRAQSESEAAERSLPLEEARENPARTGAV